MEDRLTAYLFDGAVVTLGTIVENALRETYEIGSDDNRQTRQRYTLKQILDPEFTLPLPDDEGAMEIGGTDNVDGIVFDEVD